MWAECVNDPTGLALLRAAVANPLEKTTRLALADGVQEQGEEAVAEVLRESIKTRYWVEFPDEVRERWTPWNACFDGWLGVQAKRLTQLPPSPWITSLNLRD